MVIFNSFVSLPRGYLDQYLYIPFLGGWTSIYQLFWCSPGVQGFDTLPYQLIRMVHIIFGSFFWSFSLDLRMKTCFSCLPPESSPDILGRGASRMDSGSWWSLWQWRCHQDLERSRSSRPQFSSNNDCVVSVVFTNQKAEFLFWEKPVFCRFWDHAIFCANWVFEPKKRCRWNLMAMLAASCCSLNAFAHRRGNMICLLADSWADKGINVVSM